MFKIIDNKKIEITDSEYKLYEEICKSFDRPNFEGKYLFKNLFEVDDQGIIIFLRAPTSTFSMEIVIFLQNLMVRQHLAKIYKEHDDALLEMKKQYEEVNLLKESYNKAINELKILDSSHKKIFADLNKLPAYKELERIRKRQKENEEKKDSQGDRVHKNR